MLITALLLGLLALGGADVTAYGINPVQHSEARGINPVQHSERAETPTANSTTKPPNPVQHSE